MADELGVEAVCPLWPGSWPYVELQFVDEVGPEHLRAGDELTVDRREDDRYWLFWRIDLRYHAAQAAADARDAGRRLPRSAAAAVPNPRGQRRPELSILAICDGRRAVVLPAARDFKRVADGDRGPNTGGMGTFSPVPGVLEGIEEVVLHEMVETTLAELRRRGIDYRGVLPVRR